MLSRNISIATILLAVAPVWAAPAASFSSVFFGPDTHMTVLYEEKGPNIGDTTITKDLGSNFWPAAVKSILHIDQKAITRLMNDTRQATDLKGAGVKIGLWDSKGDSYVATYDYDKVKHVAMKNVEDHWWAAALFTRGNDFNGGDFNNHTIWPRGSADGLASLTGQEAKRDKLGSDYDLGDTLTKAVNEKRPVIIKTADGDRKVNGHMLYGNRNYAVLANKDTKKWQLSDPLGGERWWNWEDFYGRVISVSYLTAPIDLSKVPNFGAELADPPCLDV
ncbi:hypothetical protein CI109_100858 [Kwoniella shandongensis]|uniref:Uncharacterized protein n=1 Tax=Kwoniella shandongensis TaxID=1734106 RepID=A0A5M6BRY9_9TREE|nr:uncharacterized protein CI109_006110 [Kwoniella shandongensis]KAA5525537.1 hypothetical protein CI109_006110 [Kwoniella shandongensis]